MRTREQIIADCEKRFEELRAEKEQRDSDPVLLYPCEYCRWSDRDEMFVSSLTEWRCNEPLVKGFKKRGPIVHGFGFDGSYPRPCGPEKALWQPKLTLCQRIMQFVIGSSE